MLVGTSQYKISNIINKTYPTDFTTLTNRHRGKTTHNYNINLDRTKFLHTVLTKKE